MHQVVLQSETDVAGWRSHARALLHARVAPEDIAWSVATRGSGLFGVAPPEPPVCAEPSKRFTVPREFLALAETVILHGDPARFGLLYRLLWRLARERRLLQMHGDPDVARAHAMHKAVDHEVHRMRAFVRFRCLALPAGPHYVAWFEPSHHIVEANAGFFIRRFANRRWSILTPLASVHWDGQALHTGPGATRAELPAEDAQEELWRTYYASIFNPARLKPAAMQAHMPKRYWRDMPETRLIAPLVAQAKERAYLMVHQPARAAVRRCHPVPARHALPASADALDTLRQAAAQCTACPLWAAATQTVFGEGPRQARILCVGEQPGDTEDLVGRPFVGPAGQLFDRALQELGIDRKRLYVTNAVKHFKYEPRGKRRLHKKPADAEVDACRSWLDSELEVVKPRLVIALGATAARALLGRSVTLGQIRGQLLEWEHGARLLVTVHPSYLLRLPDTERPDAYREWVTDLRLAVPFVNADRLD
jgi:probable DNA metabolism protein